MVKWIKLVSFLFVFLLVGCSANEESAKSDMLEKDSADYSNEVANISEEAKEESLTDQSKETESSKETKTQRMIIHNADISANVKELSVAQEKITQKVKKYNGYIVESTVYQESESNSYGKMVVRVPEEHFETFLVEAESEVTKVLEHNVTGEDVTEQYVDLESRLKSKRAVEARLLVFMEKAEKTEDLLKISDDLAKVQEEIEIIVGKMKFLENQTSLSTIEMTLYENKIVVPSIENDDLNTWEKIKKQFVTSINFLLSIGSSILVLLLGNLPVLIILGVLAFISYSLFKRRKK
ncbi:DUF4349 domain-containing protein [Psychrobacillus sp. Sa2BUA9]|uniref:DUF4349 domain-containing protein n=1 Tax=Psychrobacillus faecigallinarum TaxID=2762235 RepID=A0ABR8R8S6_9BACI|nr:DUF4349 domain-containing protein [Psychrobacillus faecigallinarum]MBD7944192.1 DUF4349 domain-containing protein [Psychrobacillus faecigallinarum]